MAHFDCIDRLLVWFFYRYGKLVARRPLLFLLGSLAMAIGLGLGLVFIHLETDVVYLFTPDRSQAREDSKYVEATFPIDYQHRFTPIRGQGIVEQGANVIIMPKFGNSVLTEEVVSEILRFDIEVQNFTVLNGTDDPCSYTTLCAIFQDACLVNPVLQAYSYNASHVSAINLTYPFYSPSSRDSIFVGASLGDVDGDEDVASGDGRESGVARAGLLSINYHLQTLPERRSLNRAWEKAFLDYAKSFESDVISLSYIVSHSLEREIMSLTVTILPYFVVACVLLSAFAVASCLVADWVLSKSLLAIMGLVSATLAVGASSGLLCYCGIDFNIVAASMPFLIMGIGIDDMFIMISAWRKTNPFDSVEERMGQTYSEAAVSITITSITDALAFGIGSITPLPAVRIFCLFTGVAVIFDYLFQITFFGACMVYSGRREAANRHCVTCAKVVSRGEAKSKFYKLFCAGGFSKEERGQLKGSCETALMAFFRDHYGPALMTPLAKVAALLLFLSYLAGAVFGLMNVTEGLEMKTLAADGSATHNFFDYLTEYFSTYGPAVSVVIEDSLNYSDPNVQQQLQDVVKDFESSEYISSGNVTEFWLNDYLMFLDVAKIPESMRQEQFMNLLVNYFLEQPFFSKYSQDIAFTDSNRTEIATSRFMILGDTLKTTDQQMAMMREMRHRAEDADLNLTAYSPMFIIYEQYVVVRPLTIQNILIAVGCMFLVALMLIPHPFCAVMVTACIVSIQAGIIGYMSLWDVRLDGISMINIILCIGFSVDFSAHITYAFLTGHGYTPLSQKQPQHQNQRKGRGLSAAEHRATMALYSLGMPILQGALSTILAILVLMWSPSYIFRTFFKVMFMVMVLGMVHSLIFLPVLLSTFGGCLSLLPSPSSSTTGPHALKKTAEEQWEEEDQGADQTPPSFDASVQVNETDFTVLDAIADSIVDATTQVDGVSCTPKEMIEGDKHILKLEINGGLICDVEEAILY